MKLCFRVASVARKPILSFALTILTVSNTCLALTLISGVIDAEPVVARSAQLPSVLSPTFDVASIKPTKAADGYNHMLEDDREGRSRLVYEGTPLIECIENAYGVKDYQISGPKWIKSMRYDIDAVGSNPTNSREFRKVMLQNLLADRFQLKLHHETREFPVYQLMVAKGGPTIGDPTTDNGPDISGTAAKTTFKGSSMSDLVRMLNRVTDLPIVDKTAIDGKYDFSLQYSRQNTSAGADPDATATAETSAPSIYTALREQLGLRLKKAKGQIEVLVIDQIAPPSDN